MVQRLKEERATIHYNHNLLNSAIRQWQLHHSTALRKQVMRYGCFSSHPRLGCAVCVSSHPRLVVQFVLVPTSDWVVQFVLVPTPDWVVQFVLISTLDLVVQFCVSSHATALCKPVM